MTRTPDPSVMVGGQLCYVWDSNSLDSRQKQRDILYVIEKASPLFKRTIPPVFDSQIQSPFGRCVSFSVEACWNSGRKWVSSCGRVVGLRFDIFVVAQR